MHPWWRAAAERLRPAATAMAMANGRHYHTIQAIPREITGPRVSARDRAQGRIPTVVFIQNHPNQTQQPPSMSKKQFLTTERKQIQSILKSVGSDLFCSTTFKLQVRAGSGSSVLLESGNVLPIKLHRDPATGKVLNMELVWAEDGSKLEVDVPVVLKGMDSCPGIKKGGKLSLIKKELKYLCPAESIPQKIEVDISNLDIGDQIMMKDIQVDQSLKLLSRYIRNPVCKIVASNVESSTSLEA